MKQQHLQPDPQVTGGRLYVPQGHFLAFLTLETLGSLSVAQDLSPIQGMLGNRTGGTEQLLTTWSLSNFKGTIVQ